VGGVVSSWEERALELGIYGVTVWSNHACLGYALVAAAKGGFSGDELLRLYDGMVSLFGSVSVEDAEKYYMGSPFYGLSRISHGS